MPSSLLSRCVLALTCGALFLATSCQSQSVLDKRFGFDLPAPTEHRLLTNAEGDNKSRRKAWIKERKGISGTHGCGFPLFANGYCRLCQLHYDKGIEDLFQGGEGLCTIYS